MTTHAGPEPPTARADVCGRSWDGRRVTVVGLGRSGVAAATLLCRVGARVRATDARETDALRATRTGLSQLGVDAVELGGHSPRFVDDADVLVVSPGVPDSAGPIQQATARGTPIVSEIELAFQFCRSPVIAVTGTNGKSTVVSLIAAVLRAAGRPAIACGNLGNPFSSVVINPLGSQTVVVVEVSSFQLSRCVQFRPKVGVLLNIGANHLDRHQDADTYVAAKAKLFERQTPEDWAVLNGSDPRCVVLGERIRAQRVWFGTDRANPPAFRLASATQRALPENAQAVLQVGRLLGIPDPLIWQVIRAFRGLEHRLECVATIRGVRFVNDSKSTTPDSTRYALAQTRGDVVVIMGGRDKGLDFAPLAERLHEERVRGVVLIGESRSRLRRLLNGSTTVTECETLDEALQAATGLVGPGSTVLFSPACASFDMFRDFEDRGRTFKDIVRRMLDAEGGHETAGPAAGRPPVAPSASHGRLPCGHSP